MQRTLNEFMVEVLQGRYDVDIQQSKYDTYKDLC